MKTYALPALAAVLALAACADSTPDDAEATTAAGTDATVAVPAPTVTETAVVAAPGASETNSTGDKVSIGPNGVSADVGDADTRVKINTDGNTVSVEKKN